MARNPILIELRGMIAGGSDPLVAFETYTRWVSRWQQSLEPATWTAADRAHALIVLGRLTSFARRCPPKMFASRVPKRLCRDPKPYESPRGVRYADGDLYFGDGPLIWDPRPEFAHAQHNPANPILAAVRTEALRTYDGNLSAWFASSIWPETPYRHLAEHQDHVDHARTVLGRLAGGVTP